MTAIYLWFNSLTYLALGIWCGLSVDKPATTVGFKVLDSSGRCEFTAVYGGLQFALGIIFAFAAARAESRPLGIMFALALYGGIVAFRVLGLIRFWPVAPTTLMFAGFELLMLLVAIGLRMATRP